MRPCARSAPKCAASDAEEPRLLHQFFEQAARRWPDKPAVDVPPGAGRPDRRLVTYSELTRQSEALACLLRATVAGECVVAILLPRNSEHLYSSQLAVLKAGAAYTGIDPASPDEQVRDILEDSRAVALLTDGEGLARAARSGFGVGRAINVMAPIERARVPAAPVPPPPWLSPESLAYIVYTSGTTGRPKGVMIEHRSIANLVASGLEEFGLSADDRVGQSSSPAYDSSVEETWLGFSAGATVVVMDDDTVRLGPDLIPWLRGERVTVLCPPPTLLRTTGCDDPAAALPALSLLYVGGEALPRDVADRWARGRRLVNGYGPTECTVTALRGRIREGAPITIGSPVRGLRAWVLDERLEEVREGEPGELCLGGIGLARGYRNRPELTAEKFPVHPRFGRICRTGDLAHRDPDGRFFYHGRIDSQVKLRGYRVELEAIESRLAECDGVRAAACRVQGDGTQRTLVAFIVPKDRQAPPPFDDLEASLRNSLPAYMIPSRFGILSELPTTVGGKLDRERLPSLEARLRDQDGSLVTPRGPIEAQIEAAFRLVLGLPRSLSLDDDFFVDLGGDSLHAALLVTRLREDAATASITVRDVYEARTVADLASRARADDPGGEESAPEAGRPAGRPVLATAIQATWLLGSLMLAASAGYVFAFGVLPFLTRSLGLIPFLLAGPFLLFAALAAYTPVAVLLAVLVKRLLIGRYRPLRAPVWGGFYVRNWMVQRAVHLVPWRLLEGTVFQHAALRALGARIGRRVHLHRGVNLLQGGWDLLEIGDDVTVGRDASIRLVDLDDGHLTVGPVSLGEGSTLDVRAGLAGETCLEPGAYLTAWSSLPSGGRIPRGERWDGIPARPAGQAPPRPSLPDGEQILRPLWHGIALILARFGLGLVLALPWEVGALSFAIALRVDAGGVLGWLSRPSWDRSVVVPGMVIAILSGPLSLALQAVVLRLLGRVPASVISRWSLSYVRVWLKMSLVQTAGELLSGTLFWPIWLRWSGMKVGRRCEISTIIDVVPEHVEIGAESFLADGIYLGGPRVHRGTVTLAPTRVGANSFLGNHVVISGGQRVPDGVLLGVCTVADDTLISAATSWFGHPPFELPRREIVASDRRLTHEPSLVRFLNRVFWEWLRFTLPVLPLLALLAWLKTLAAAEAAISRPVFLAAVVPLVTLATAASFCLLVLALKWALLGRVRPGLHPLWSCWCSRWDFLYVAWGFYASGVLSALEGTLLLPWYLRAMGVRVGRGVALGGGFAQVVDPDMLVIEDGATVNGLFQAHSFEDRVLKIDRVTIRRGATVGDASVLLYGADVGARARVAPHSVVMKHERLPAGRSYAGCPTQRVLEVTASAEDGAGNVEPRPHVLRVGL
jgi:non-ribosomal peptide synthetase-like protein